jgi:hypothetical protein
MLRVTVFRLAAAEHVVFVVVPHIVSDMGTIQIVIHDLLVLYLHFAAGRPSPLPERPLQYADFVHWQRDWVQGDLRRTVGEYLERQWRGSRAVTLPVDHVQPAGPRNPDGGKYLFSLAPALATQLREVSRQFRVTPFMVVLGVFSLVVAAWAEQDDVSMVVPFAGRPGTDGSGIVGLFSNPCPVRVDVGGDPTFADVLERSRVAVADAWSYRCVPYAVLSDVATAHGGLPRPTIGMNCLIDVGRLVPADCADLVPIGTDITPFVLEIDACRAVRQTRGDLNLWVRFEPNASVTMTFIYRLAAFERETMAAAAGTLTRCLETCLADPTCRRSIAV